MNGSMWYYGPLKKSLNVALFFDTESTYEARYVRYQRVQCITSTTLGPMEVWRMGVSEGIELTDWMDSVLDEPCFFSTLYKEECLKFPLLLTVGWGLGSSRIGEGVSWQGGSGEAGSGDPRGVRWGEKVKSKVGADLSAAVRVQNKHRCSNSWPQKLDRESKVNMYMLFYISIYS